MHLNWACVSCDQRVLFGLDSFPIWIFGFPLIMMYVVVGYRVCVCVCVCAARINKINSFQSNVFYYLCDGTSTHPELFPGTLPINWINEIFTSFIAAPNNSNSIFSHFFQFVFFLRKCFILLLLLLQNHWTRIYNK